jgi:AraC-like DNA-binding protein
MPDKLIPKLNLQNPLVKLAEEAGAISENENLVKLQGGGGYVYSDNSDYGLSVRVWGVAPDRPIELYDDIPLEKGNTFKLLIILTPESCVLKKLGFHLQFNRLAHKSVLLATEDINLHFELLPNQRTSLIDIRFTYAWLALNLPGPALIMVQKLIQPPHSPLILLDPLPDAYDVANHQPAATSLCKEPLCIPEKAIIVRLISDFLEKALNQQTDSLQSKDDFYAEKLMEVENILYSYLQKDLPKLNVIARQVALSESTLKRHFKEAFGKNVYGYYLEKKMELARHLLSENGLTVRQVALNLGYENVSNFIEIFRKNCGCSPGSIKKNRVSRLYGHMAAAETRGS